MSDLILYVLIRTDMESMKYGKGSAQSSHASNQFTDDHIIVPLLAGKDPMPDAMEWRAQADGFGTTLTLAMPSLMVMADVVEAAETLGYKAALVTDPEYPFLVPNEMVNRLDASKFTAPPRAVGRDKTACFVRETTTAYVFGPKAPLEILLKGYSLISND